MVMDTLILVAVASGAGFLGWWLRGRVHNAGASEIDPANLEKARSETAEARERLAAAQATAEQHKTRIGEVASERDVARDAAVKSAQAVETMRRELEVGKAEIAQERKSLEEQAELMRKNRIELTQAFTSAAQELLKTQSKDLREVNTHEITQLLRPFREQIDNLHKDVKEASTERHSLQENIARIALEANSLTNALRGDPKAQGDWGEFVLSTILETSGLNKDVNYFLQYAYKNDEGKQKFLDVLIKLPDERYMVVDSKTVITEYDRYMNAETKEEKNQHLDDLVNSLKSQVNGLTGKYEKIPGLETLEAVLMWVPNEGALTVAIRHDRSLVEYAHRRRVIPVTATTLFAIIKVVERLWVYEKQNKSVQDIINRAASIYDKVVGFTEAMDGLGKALDNALSNFHQAKSRLLEGKGNAIRQLEQLHDLAGLPTKGRLKGEWSQQEDGQLIPAPDKK